MKKVIFMLCSVVIMASLVACTKKETPLTDTTTVADNLTETLTGKGDGYGGEISVTITKAGGKISEVIIVGGQETNGIGTMAIEQLPAKIVQANGSDVDIIAGATITSNGIIAAVNNALDPIANPYPTIKEEVKQDPASVEAASVYQGFGLANNSRVGPGQDSEDISVYSINQVVANVLFDEEGRILAINIDQIEVATPNYDGASMPDFSGFPGQGGYNVDLQHDGTITGKNDDSEENFLAEVADWQTKRERGADYKLGAGTWASQMDIYQELFVGKTVAEVKAWYNDYCSDVNGRPLTASSENEKDIIKYNALSESDKERLADVISGATISLNDVHGNIIAAIEKADQDKIPVAVEVATGIGTGIVSSGRIGPGKDAEEVPVYSFNQVFANTIVDQDGKIAALYIDQLEVSTPNYDGEGMPHFSGFPGQKAYIYDEKHDQKLIQREPTEETFQFDIDHWQTKRERGQEYRMGTGTWASQMDAYQKIFVGMTVADVQEWFTKYCSDINGRPLQENSDNEEDIVKFNELSKGEQEMLVDVISGATMSLNDSHGDIIGAIQKSLDHQLSIDLKVKK